MILGVGIDVVQISGFAQLLADPASSFVQVTFTSEERRYCEQAVSKAPQQHYAARYAAKEALLKALDQAHALQPTVTRASQLALHDIEVVRDIHGRLSLQLRGEAQNVATRLGVDRFWLSLSHDGDYASAVVMAERLS